MKQKQIAKFSFENFTVILHENTSPKTIAAVGKAIKARNATKNQR